MKIPTCILSITVLAGSLSGQFIADNFNNTGGTTTDMNDDLALRQSGSYVTANGTVSWAEFAAGGLSPQDMQIRNDQMQTNLGGATTSAGRAGTYLNQDFATDLAGANYTVQFDLNTELFSASGVPDESTSVNDTILRFLIADGTGISGGSSGGWDIALNFTPFYDSVDSRWEMRSYFSSGLSDSVDIPVNVVDLGSEAKISSILPVFITIDEANNTLTATLDGQTIVSNGDITGAFGSERYFGFEGRRSSGVPTSTGLQHEVDNFQINVIPEPSAYGILIGLISGCLVIARRRK